MVGIIGIIAALTVLGISLIITRIASTALSLTGLSLDAARFQARSAFTGTGFTTQEAEKIVSHPLRRKIIMWLMIARSAGLLSIVISLILSFGNSGDDATTQLIRLIWLIAGVAVLWILARSDYLERWMRSVVKKALRKWTDLDLHDYVQLLKLSGEYTVREITVHEGDWLAEKQLNKCHLRDEGLLVLGIYRTDGTYVGAPVGSTTLYPGDVMVLYGRGKALKSLEKRHAGTEGEQEHEKAKSEQRQAEAEAEQSRKDADYEKSKKK